MKRLINEDDRITSHIPDRSMQRVPEDILKTALCDSF